MNKVAIGHDPYTLPIIAGFLGAFVLSACEEEPQGRQVVNRREVKPPPGEGGSGTACLVIRNRAPFTITGRVVLKSRGRASFRIARNRAEKICVAGTLYGNNTVSFIITSFVTIPIFSCFTTIEHALDVVAYKNQDGWIYNASCQR